MTTQPPRAGLAAALLCTLLASVVQAQEKHDSNTLHKIGKAIQYPVNKAGQNASKTAHKAAKATQYPVRKAGENASVTAHQATQQNSVVRRREKEKNRVVTPKGKVYTMHQAKKKGLAQ